MRFENINMLNDTMAIMDRGYYEVNGKRVNLKLSKKEMKEISVFLPKDVKRISDSKDFQHVHVMGRIGVGCVNMDSYSLAIKRYSDCSYMFNKKSKPILVLNLANPVNPGGGVRRGSKAQEEDLCRKSSLLLSLESSKASAYYKYNKSLNTYMGSDAVMITPQVEIIKDEKGNRLVSSVNNVYENSFLSYIGKGESIYIAAQSLFTFRFDNPDPEESKYLGPAAIKQKRTSSKNVPGKAQGSLPVVESQD